MRKNGHFLPFSPRYQTTARHALKMDFDKKLRLELLNLHKRFQGQRLLCVAVWSTQTFNFSQKCAKMRKKTVFFNLPRNQREMNPRLYGSKVAGKH